MATTRFLVILALALAVGPAPVAGADPDPGDSGPVHFCDDPAADQEWAEILAGNPQDDVVVRLYALREGLCSMIAGDLLPVERAIVLFEEEREKAIIERRRLPLRRALGFQAE
jgi:hypothetical protein